LFEDFGSKFKKMKASILSALILLFSIQIFAQTSYSPKDDGSKVHFVIKNFGVNTGGDFNGLSGAIKFDPNNPATADFDVSVDVSTIDTDIESRDRDMKKEQYFDVKNYPKMTFKSTKVTKTNKADYLYMYGNITIKGVTKEIKFPFKATAKDGGYLFEGNFKLNRRDFGVGGSSMSLSDELTVSLAVLAK
jgi:polyisoprenoid-binding protein YceI